MYKTIKIWYKCFNAKYSATIMKFEKAIKKIRRRKLNKIILIKKCIE